MYRTVVTLIGLFLAASAAQAVPVKQASPEQALSPSLLFQYDPSLLRDSRLREITKLMESGQRQEANLKIANLLAENSKDKDALELAGISLMQMQNFKAAEESFRRLIDLPPVKPGVVAKYGVTKILNGDLEGGARLLQQVVQHVPDDALANRYLGWVAEKTGNHGPATHYLARLPSIQTAGLQEYHVALARNYWGIGASSEIIDMFESLFPKNKIENNQLVSGAAFYLTLAYASKGKLNESSRLATALKPLIADDPLNTFGLDMGLAQISGDEKTGRKALNDLITSVPGAEAAGRFEMAKLYAGVNDIPKAIAEFEATIELVDEKEAANILHTLIPLLIRESMTSHAISIMQKLVKKYPSNNELLYGLAELQTLSGMNQDAAKTVKQLINQPQPYTSAYLLGAKLAQNEGKKDLAKRYLDAYTQSNPKNPEGWINLARLYIDQQDRDKAIQSIQTGIKASPAAPSLKFELGSLYQSQGEFMLANQQYRDALKLNSNFFQAMDNLASNLLDANEETEEAYNYAQTLYKTMPKDPYIQDLMGWALFRKGDLNGANKHLAEAASAITDSGRADYHLALLLRELGKKEVAIKHFKLALDKGLEQPLLGAAKIALKELQ